MNTCGKSAHVVLHFRKVLNLFLILMISLVPIASTQAGYLGLDQVLTENQPPTAVDDNGAGFITREDQVLFTGNVLLNDTDPDGDPLFVSALDSSSAKGLVSQVSGRLDASFGQSGKISTKIDSDYTKSTDIVIQLDGKTVMVGYGNYDVTGYDFVILRYNMDGNLDQSFGEDGVVVTDFGINGTDKAYAVVLQSDNKIVVVGYSTDDNLAVARYNTDGSLDVTFGEDGKVTASGTMVMDYDLGAAIQADGKIVVAGTCYDNFGYGTIIARFNPDGNLDPSFDGDGILVTDLNVGAAGDDVVIQSDNKILISGRAINDNKQWSFIFRLNPNGSLDTSFDGDGLVLTDIGFDSSGRQGIAIALQMDNKIVVAGNCNSNFYLIRYHPDGSLDTTFNGDGIASTNLIYGAAIAIQPSGKIDVIGTSEWLDIDSDMSVVRFNPDGSFDTAFGDAGVVNIGFVFAYGSAIALGANGRINVAGYMIELSGYTLTLAQLSSDGIFSYNPNHQFDDLPAGARAYDTFTYTASDGVLTDTATVTITITGKGYVYLPLVSYRPGIYGKVTESGVPASGIWLDLRFYNGSSWTTFTSTTTNSSGDYNFYNLPNLAPGQGYYVLYQNPGINGKLLGWATRVLTSYTSSSPVNIGNFDIADINLIQPYPYQVTLPYTFEWVPRLPSLNDSYEFNLFDPDDGDPYFYTDPPLGYVDSYTLSSLPPGFWNGVEYFWEIWVYSPDGGYGISHHTRSVIFTNSSMASSTNSLTVQLKHIPEPLDRALK